ncbi:hypothetical protein PAAG_01612 [Paracoccidioides lutzii Pb01]|uniref:Uncharacterized protein n=1 Tax=Paracoccidioides lutzii (strain ATCC MYA-826 / Pb01) TaxID=502779 RepID=C1GSW7_PARBA|nr:hypothetical protein PAAG_01612 [Paracoccidioides lutzii Pb01]EEH39150.2 hypothetical protein PAAG_01612 [Paracoccidioides lutzii Pb01]
MPQETFTRFYLDQMYHSKLAGISGEKKVKAMLIMGLPPPKAQKAWAWVPPQGKYAGRQGGSFKSTLILILSVEISRTW